MDIQVITQDQVCRCAWSLVIVLCLGVGCAGMRLAGRTDHPVPRSLSETINPNTATVGSLIRLPGVGLHRARMIVSYRDQFRTTHDTAVAFACQADLVKVQGLGEKTVAGFSQCVCFE